MLQDGTWTNFETHSRSTTPPNQVTLGLADGGAGDTERHRRCDRRPGRGGRTRRSSSTSPRRPTSVAPWRSTLRSRSPSTTRARRSPRRARTRRSPTSSRRSSRSSPTRRRRTRRTITYDSGTKTLKVVFTQNLGGGKVGLQPGTTGNLDITVKFPGRDDERHDREQLRGHRPRRRDRRCRAVTTPPRSCPRTSTSAWPSRSRRRRPA